MTSIDNMASEIVSALTNYSQEVTEIVKDECKKAAADAAKELKSTSHKATGDYAKGWTAYRNFDSKYDAKYVVWNKEKWQLVHLLNNGHVIKNGTKRVFGNVKGDDTVTNAEKHIAEKLEGKIKVRIIG